MQRILVSACLLGVPVRHDGRARPLHDPRLAAWQAEGRLVPLCPEVAAGLPTPRAAAELSPGCDAAQVLAGRGAIRDLAGRDLTDLFRRGAAFAVALAASRGCAFALLTDASPSCGTTRIHAGRFDGTTRPGRGVVAEALAQAGVAVFPAEDLDALAAAVESAAAGPRPC